MKWTSQPPTEPGWYWFRDSPIKLPSVYRVDHGHKKELTVYTNRGEEWELSELQKYSEQPEWCGPIPEPT